MKRQDFLTPVEVAEILKIARNTVYELIKRGELPACRVGRKIRISMEDFEAYKNRNNNARNHLPKEQAETITAPTKDPLGPDTGSPDRLIICGQDILLDILARHLEKHPKGTKTFRHYVGSFAGLMALYQGEAQVAAIHLLDGDTGKYNIPYVRHLLPGIKTILIHLAVRTQGFYVIKGNPKNIKTWQDLTHPEIVFLNREKGCGTRVLLDENLRQLGIDSRSIKGYDREELSHLSVASGVARGEADVGLGHEKAALQVRNLDFVPLQKERYELVIRKEDLEKAEFQAVLEIIRSEEYKSDLRGLGDYELTDIGKIVAEI